MNKSDIKLVFIILFIVSVLLIFINVNREECNMAEVYYENKLIRSISLDIDGEYIVDGELGDIVLEVKNKKIRVKSENSPKNICSKMGYIDDKVSTLICLPNKIIVKIVGDTEIDGVIY